MDQEICRHTFTNGVQSVKILYDNVLKGRSAMNREKETTISPELEANPSKIIEEIDESSDQDIREPFDPTKIDMTVKPLIIDSLIKRMKSVPSRIALDTEFQRRGNLWSDEAQSRLIESLLVRIPLPAFYFDGSDENCWKVVDGLQRLTTLKRFIIDKELELKNMEFLNQYNGIRFDDLPAYLQGRIEETHITAYIINPGTPDDVKFNIFKRINTGGLILKPQEIRHALNQGIPANFVKELAELPEFQKATHGLLIDHQRMEDRDFVTRFIAFYDGYDNYRSDLDTHLHDKMKDLIKLSHEEREKIKNDFIKAMTTAFKIFGDDAFRKVFIDKNRKFPLNKALFDTWSVNLSRLDESTIKHLISKKKHVIEAFKELMESNDFIASITTSTGKFNSVKTRFIEIEKLLDGFKEL